MTQGLSGFERLAFFPADHAEAIDGKVYVNGGYWCRLNFPSFPQPLNLTLVAVLKVPFGEYQAEHTFTMGLEDAESGRLPLDVEGSFRVGADPGMNDGEPTVLPVTVPVANLSIPHAGDYAFTLAVDDERLGRYPFRAVQLQAPLQFTVDQPQPKGRK